MFENIKPDSIMNTISNVSHGYRRVTSPLPAVPPSPKFFTLSHPPPKPPLNRSKKPDENSNIPKSASEIDLENSTDPLLGYEQPITGKCLMCIFVYLIFFTGAIVCLFSPILGMYFKCKDASFN